MVVMINGDDSDYVTVVMMVMMLVMMIMVIINGNVAGYD